MRGFPIGLSEETWERGFHDVRFPAFVLDRQLAVRASNPAGERWLGGRDLPEVLGRERLVRAMRADEGGVTVLPAGEGREGAVLLMFKEGMLVCPSDDLEGTREHVRLFAAYARAMDIVRKRNDRLEVYHELLTHDAPNYLTAIYGYLQMLQSQELPPDKRRRYVEASLRQTEALNHLIDTARTLRQLETRPLGPTLPRDLRSMVEESVAAVTRANEHRGAVFQDRIPPGSYPVRAEEGLGEVFTIILNNAVQYADSPRVGIDLAADGGCWHLRFEDNGRGIPDDKKEFVFLRFDRLDRQKKIRGSGLSLALARALVERHGGLIWVDNRVPGDHAQGSVFHVLLPRA